MSDASSFFSPNVNPTLEERIAVLEQKLPAYQNRIAAYDKLFDALTDVILKIEMEKEKTDGHRVAIDAVGTSLGTLNKTMNDRINKLQSDLSISTQNTTSSTQSVESLKSSFLEKLVSVVNDVSSFKKEVVDAFTKFATTDLVNEKSQTHTTQIANVVKELDNHKSSTRTGIDAVNSSIEAVKNIAVNASCYADDFSEIMRKIGSLKGELVTARDEFPARISQVEAKISQAVDALRTEFTSKPSELTDFKADISKKMEPIALDANSANVRSQTMDKRIFLLEKQLENVQLLVKKIELK